MITVVTRVKSASVEAKGHKACIGGGFLCLVGVHEEDTRADAEYTADRLWGLRVFEDDRGRMNLSAEAAGQTELLVVSQFTLIADLSQRRPSFSKAARPDPAKALYERLITACAEKGFTVKTGVFGEDMQVCSQNDGPVTLIIDSGVN